MSSSSPTQKRTSWRWLVPLGCLGSCVLSCVVFTVYQLGSDVLLQRRVREEARTFAGHASAQSCVGESNYRYRQCRGSAQLPWEIIHCGKTQQFFTGYCVTYAADRDAWCETQGREFAGEGAVAESIRMQCADRRTREQIIASDPLPDF